RPPTESPLFPYTTLFRSKDGSGAPHPQVVLIACIGAQIRLINIVSPDCVECGDIAGHARHETREKRSNAEPQHAGGELMQEHTRSEEHTSELQSPCNLVC